MALDLIAFPARAVPGEVAPDTIFNLGLIDSPVTIVPALIGALFYAGYRINKDAHEKIRATLESRHLAEETSG